MPSSSANPKKPDWRRLLAALPQANDRDLVRLRLAIDRILLDPQRIAAIRRDLKVGQTIAYVSERRNRVSEGRVVELMADRVLIETGEGMLRWLHYASIQVSPSYDGDVESAEKGPLPYAAGDVVSYDDRGVHRFGKVVRVNRKTATLEIDGRTVRVPHAALRPVVDI